MKKEMSHIIIATIFAATALYGLGAFDKSEYTYATVNFDGGFIKIGEIAEQRAFSTVDVTMNNETLWSGDIEKVVAAIRLSIQDSGNLDVVTWKEGVRVKGNVGIKWVGSESSFELTTDSFDMVSTKESPLKPMEIISMLNKFNVDIKGKHQVYAKESLTFSVRPNNSFLLSKVLAALRS